MTIDRERSNLQREAKTNGGIKPIRGEARSSERKPARSSRRFNRDDFPGINDAAEKIRCIYIYTYMFMYIHGRYYGRHKFYRVFGHSARFVAILRVINGG